MAVSITGGHGHIGSWAAYFLAKEGEQIILFDTNSMAPDHLDEVSKNITFVKGDVMVFPCLTEIYNIATGVPTSLGRMAELSCKYSSFPVKVELGPGELMQRCEALDISRAREELGFEPEYSVEEGVQKYARWIENKLK